MAAVTLAACSESRDGGGGGGAVPIEALPDRLSTAACGKIDACYGELATIIDAVLGGCDTTLEGQLADVTVPRLQAAIAAGTVVYHDDLMGTCLSMLRTSSCATITLEEAPAVCEDAIEGTVALGGACNIDEECVGDAYCNFTGACPGACTPRAGLGMACTSNDHCVRGSTCTRGTCMARAAPGGACGGGLAPECGGGEICIGDDSSEMRTGSCRSADAVFTVAAGGTCNFETGLLCAGGLSCTVVSAMPPTLTCQPGVGAGAACNFGFPDPCPDTQYCDADLRAGRISGTCRALPGEGQPCAPGIFATCAPGLRCESDVCRRTARVGGACVDDGDCYSRTCTAGTCAEPPFCEGPA